MFEVGERQSRPTRERVLVSDNLESFSKLRDIQLCFTRAVSFVEGELLNVQDLGLVWTTVWINIYPFGTKIEFYGIL